MRIITSTVCTVMALHPRQGVCDLKNAGFENAMLLPELLTPDFFQICGEVGVCLPVGKLLGMRNIADARNTAGADNTAGVKDTTGTGNAIDAKNALAVGNLMDAETAIKAKKTADVETIAAYEAAGCQYVIASPLSTDVPREQEWALNRAYYLELARSCKKDETMILLKNQCRNVGGHLIRGSCADAEEAIAWLEELNRELGMERFGFCMDAGVCNICGQDMRELAISLGNSLKAVIMRDNNGREGLSLLPFASGSFGQTDWLSLIRGLREIEFDGDLIFDFAGTAGAFSPLLRPGLLTVAKSVADYFEWQINLEAAIKRYDAIVLFGAGNMCRNYMKNYGEKYPPLFTCDNSPVRWGEIFCGLEVRPPEALRELPRNCGVFICNIYYREIERQLAEMGVENVEYFSDEIMPSFYMDRLEMR